MSNERRGMLLMLCCAIMWSLSGVLTKLTPFHPFVISGFRSLLAGIVLFVFMRIIKVRVAITLKTMLLAADIAIIFLLYVPAVKMTSAANAIVLQYTAPVYVLLLCALLYKQRIKRGDALAVVLTIAGIALFFLDQIGGGSMLGNALALASGLFLAGMFIIVGRMTEQERLSGLLFGQIITVIIGIPFFFTTAPVITSVTMLYLVIHGVIQLGIPYCLYTMAVRTCPPLTCSLISVIEPLLNPIWVFLVIGERPSLLSLLGMLIVLATVTCWCVWDDKRRARMAAQAAQLEVSED